MESSEVGGQRPRTVNIGKRGRGEVEVWLPLMESSEVGGQAQDCEH
jgi:hypothetical protein